MQAAPSSWLSMVVSPAGQLECVNEGNDARRGLHGLQEAMVNVGHARADAEAAPPSTCGVARGDEGVASPCSRCSGAGRGSTELLRRRARGRAASASSTASARRTVRRPLLSKVSRTCCAVIARSPPTMLLNRGGRIVASGAAGRKQPFRNLRNDPGLTRLKRGRGILRLALSNVGHWPMGVLISASFYLPVALSPCPR